MQLDPPKPFTDVQPTVGYDFIPPVGTVPQPLMMQALTQGILKMLYERGSHYEGQTNSEGKKHGKGRCTYIDGSYYDGSWQDDKKHGWGELKMREGTTYKGEWEHDHKNGNGKLFLPNGDVVTTTFKNDRKNG